MSFAQTMRQRVAQSSLGLFRQFVSILDYWAVARFGCCHLECLSGAACLAEALGIHFLRVGCASSPIDTTSRPAHLCHTTRRPNRRKAVDLPDEAQHQASLAPEQKWPPQAFPSRCRLATQPSLG